MLAGEAEDAMDGDAVGAGDSGGVAEVVRE